MDYKTFENNEAVYEYIELSNETLYIDKVRCLEAVIKIPSKINGKQVTVIGDGAFSNCKNLKTIEIPEGVTKIGYVAFEKCEKLEKVVIPNSTIEIDGYAFADCVSLLDVNLPLTIKHFGSYPFLNIGNPEIIAEMNKINPEKYLVTNEAIIRYSIQDDETIKIDEVSDLKSTEVTIPEKIDNQEVTVIGENAFYSCDMIMESVSLPSTIKKIESHAFSGCGLLTEINLPQGLEEIESYVFNACTSLESIVIPDSVTEVGSQAFYGCYNLKSVFIMGKDKVINENAFINCHPDITFWVLNSTVGKVQETKNCKIIKNDIGR